MPLWQSLIWELLEHMSLRSCKHMGAVVMQDRDRAELVAQCKNPRGEKAAHGLRCGDLQRFHLRMKADTLSGIQPISVFIQVSEDSYKFKQVHQKKFVFVNIYFLELKKACISTHCTALQITQIEKNVCFIFMCSESFDVQ